MRQFLSSTIVLVSSTLYAAVGDSVMCPGGINFVKIGDSTAMVSSICGAPKRRFTKTIKQQSVNQIDGSNINWIYGNNGFSKGLGAHIVTFNRQDKIVALSDNGQLATSLSCPKGKIVIGDTMRTCLLYTSPSPRD